MFEALDKEIAEATARELDTAAVVNELAAAKFISEDCAAQVVRDLSPLFRLLLTRRGDREKDWEDLQKHWGFASASPRITPMNAANLCPRPTALVQAINSMRLDYNLNVAQQKRTRDGRRVKELDLARRFVALGVGLPQDSEDLVIVRNASEGNNLINRGFMNWSKDGRDNVVVWTQNHPTNLEAWKMRAEWNRARPSDQRRLFEIRPVTPDFNKEGVTDDDIADAFIEKIDDRTRFVTFSETSNGNGQRIPDKAIERIWNRVTSRHPNCHVHIDGTMTWGARRVNLGTPHCHSFVSSSHKWFVGPKETGMLYMSEDKVKNFMPSIFAYDYKIEYPNPWTTMPDTALRFQLLGQRDDVNIIALIYSQIFWLLLHRWKPYERVAHLAAELKKAVQKDGWTLISPENPDHSSGVVWIEAPEKRLPTLYEYLYDNPRFRVGAGGGGDKLRLCPHIYNTESDIRQVVRVMNHWRAGGA